MRRLGRWWGTAPHTEKGGPPPLHPETHSGAGAHTPPRPKLWEVPLQGLHDQHRRRWGPQRGLHSLLMLCGDWGARLSPSVSSTCIRQTPQPGLLWGTSGQYAGSRARKQCSSINKCNAWCNLLPIFHASFQKLPEAWG